VEVRRCAPRSRAVLPAGGTTGGGERTRRRLAASAGMAERRAGWERSQEDACDRRRLGRGWEEDETQQAAAAGWGQASVAMGEENEGRAEELLPSEAGEPSEGISG